MDQYLIFIIVGVVVVAVFFVLKRASLVPAATARKLIAEGALIIDVRTEQEYRSEHIPNTINIPLDSLKDRFPSVAPDKQKPILLHCLSGGRSAIARSMVKKMGYSNAYNLGSLPRARQLIESA